MQALRGRHHSSNLAVAPRARALTNASLDSQEAREGDTGLGAAGSLLWARPWLPWVPYGDWGRPDLHTWLAVPFPAISPFKSRITGKQTLGGERRVFLIKSLREFTS